MSKTYTYYIPSGGEHYSEATDENFCDEVQYDYVVTDSEIKNAIEDILFDTYFSKCKLDKEQSKLVKKALSSLINNYEFNDLLEDSLDDDLKDYFEEDAFKSARD